MSGTPGAVSFSSVCANPLTAPAGAIRRAKAAILQQIDRLAGEQAQQKIARRGFVGLVGRGPIGRELCLAQRLELPAGETLGKGREAVAVLGGKIGRPGADDRLQQDRDIARRRRRLAVQRLAEPRASLDPLLQLPAHSPAISLKTASRARTSSPRL